MEKLQMCRICLAKNVSTYILVDQNIQELYERLTNIPFVTEDTRPTLACLSCYTKLKQCYQLQQQCVEAEKLFAQIINEPNPSINGGQPQCSNGFGKIIDDDLNDVVIKQGSPDNHEELEEMIEPMEEPQSEGTIAARKPKQVSMRKNVGDLLPEEQYCTEQSKTKIFKTPENVTFKEPPKCNLCHLGFISKSILLKHIRTHTDEKRHKCETCHRSFSNKEDQLKHMRTHTGEKLYKCWQCQRSFARKSHLKRHVPTHFGEKPYKCNLCKHACSSKGELLEHIGTHFGENPYRYNIPMYV